MGKAKQDAGAFLGRVPPHSKPSELFVLGAALLFPDRVLDVVRDLLQATDFYYEAHGIVYQAMLDLRARREPVDVITVAEEAQKRYAEITPQAVSKLMDAVPTSSGWEGHAKRVASHARVRRVINAAIGILDAGYTKDLDVDAFCQEAEANVLEAARQGNVYEAVDLWHEAIHLFDELTTRSQQDTWTGDVGMSSGIEQLDGLTCGLLPTEVWIVAAPPSMGKTAFALGVARQATCNVLVFSLEQARRQLAYRQIAAITGMSVPTLRRPGTWMERAPDVADQLLNAASASRKLYVDDRSGLTSVQIRSTARRMVHQHHVGLVVVDYMGLVRPLRDDRNREQQVAAISADLKEMAKELSVPVIILSQMNRQYSRRSENARPVLADLRESGAVEQDADMVLFLWRPTALKDGTRFTQRNEEDEVAELILAKNRNGPTGLLHAWYNGPRMQWRSMTEGEASGNAATYHASGGTCGKDAAAGEGAERAEQWCDDDPLF